LSALSIKKIKQLNKKLEMNYRTSKYMYNPLQKNI